MDHFTKPSNEDRLDVFASVQFDPEVWELVQKKYNHFEDLHHKLEGLQTQRRDLLSQLSTVNSSISAMQDQIVTLSGKEVEDKAPMSTAAIEPEVQAAQDEEETEPMVGLAPLEAETDEPDEPTNEAAMAWPGIEAAPLSFAEEKPADTLPAEPEKAIEAYQPAVQVEPEPIVAPAPVMPAQVSFAQPIKEVDTHMEPVVETPAAISAEPMAEIVMPTEVHDLQQLFDGADDKRRQSDSALKLVQLYDGKADVFFSAMCRSHQQSGLSGDDARQEAIKDVQTMITTAKNHDSASVVTKKPQGGVRRLFSH
jgi:hypothetical protein